MLIDLMVRFLVGWLAVSAFSPSVADAGLPVPNLNVAYITDPRADAGAANVSVIGFYYPSHDIKVDTICGAPFLGNFWAPALIKDFAPPNFASDPHTFNCSEACYWASQWWSHASEFEGKDGQQVFDLAQKLIKDGVPSDPTFGGFGSAWKMMRVILRMKFVAGSELANGLLSTQDAYLVEHQEGHDSDNEWSDYCNGSGKNWLGLQLMELRDELRSSKHGGWSAYAATAYDLETGVPQKGEEAWLKTVSKAAKALNTALPYTCPPRNLFV
eukprot:gnl/MRDRNA2_/MRDRNA2_60419_c0_seq1.p1 gnl/MRDRNA2_/MRDRNA2_60419_c0~~gnl/MRDRNA2_/MRDRNA2_60419_c0_seq1.p1  ORF type:complete len:271 (+),score=60.42 gnl/MRDRNA2_/MRDRNA2_60419_c0_seq1:63-875(+)